MNLKSSKVELREKIFVDKPVHKQLEITMELKAELTTKSAQLKKQGSGYFANDVSKAGAGAQTYMPTAQFADGNEAEDREERKAV